jgi:N-acetylmuramoyl-L-alanine amidase
MKKYFVFMLISLMLLTSGVVYSHELDSKLVGKVIVLDAGHGGKDRGTSVNDIYESDINLSLVLKLKNVLNKHGVDVLLTRDGDYHLSSPKVSRRKKSDFDNRISLINNSRADLYLSIHINYLIDSRYYGAQVFYTNENEELANVLQTSMVNNLGSPLKEKRISDSIYMYKQLLIPGVLIECGFLSNDKEKSMLITDKYQDKIVDAIVDGLIKYY